MPTSCKSEVWPAFVYIVQGGWWQDLYFVGCLAAIQNDFLLRHRCAEVCASLCFVQAEVQEPCLLRQAGGEARGAHHRQVWGELCFVGGESRCREAGGCVGEGEAVGAVALTA